MIVQIYGFTTPADIVGVQDLAIDNIGVVLDEGFGTWDGVDQQTARDIVAEIPDSMTTVALSLGTDFDRIARTVDVVQPDIVHLVRADQMGLDAVGEVSKTSRPGKGHVHGGGPRRVGDRRGTGSCRVQRLPAPGQP